MFEIIYYAIWKFVLIMYKLLQQSKTNLNHHSKNKNKEDEIQQKIEKIPDHITIITPSLNNSEFKDQVLLDLAIKALNYNIRRLNFYIYKSKISLQFKLNIFYLYKFLFFR